MPQHAVTTLTPFDFSTAADASFVAFLPPARPASPLPAVCTPASLVVQTAAKAPDRWAAASDEKRAVALERLAYCRAAREEADRPGSNMQLGAARAACRTELYPHLAKAGKLHYENARNWLRKLGRKRDGSPDWDNRAALLDGYHGGKKAEASMEHPFIKTVARFYLDENKRELSESYRLAQMDLRARRQDHPEMRLSYHQVVRFFARPELRDAIFIARHGEEAFYNERADWIDRDWSQVAVGACLVMDHHRFDAAIRIPDPDTADGWLPVRPWLSMAMCNRSLYFAGWQISHLNPDSVTCETSLLLAIRRMGNAVPTWIYTDNGKDYLARGFVEDVIATDPETGRQHRHSIVRALGINTITAIAYNARAKTVERQFKEVAGKFAKYWYGYLGNRPGARPWNGDDAWQHPNDLPTLQEFTDTFAWWVDNMYHPVVGEHSKVTGGRTAAEMWATRKPERPPLTDADLFRAFMRPLARNGRDPLFLVGRGGRIRLDNCTYQDAALWKWQDRKVLLKRSNAPGDDAVYACTPDGSPICRVPAKETIAAIAATDDDRARISSAQRANRRQLVDARAVARQLTGEKTVGGARTIPVGDRLELAAAAGLELDADQAPAPTLPAASRSTISAGDAAILEAALSGRAPEPAFAAPGTPAAARSTADDDHARLLAFMRGDVQ
jgi:transposase InsO family protein